jgi:hypothetical protein
VAGGHYAWKAIKGPVKPHPNSLDTILTNPMMVIKEDGDGQQTWETDATQQ